jgi:hypothetical protein
MKRAARTEAPPPATIRAMRARSASSPCSLRGATALRTPSGSSSERRPLRRMRRCAGLRSRSNTATGARRHTRANNSPRRSSLTSTGNPSHAPATSSRRLPPSSGTWPRARPHGGCDQLELRRTAGRRFPQRRAASTQRARPIRARRNCARYGRVQVPPRRSSRRAGKRAYEPTMRPRLGTSHGAATWRSRTAMTRGLRRCAERRTFPDGGDAIGMR